MWSCCGYTLVSHCKSLRAHPCPTAGSLPQGFCPLPFPPSLPLKGRAGGARLAPAEQRGQSGQGCLCQASGTQLRLDLINKTYSFHIGVTWSTSLHFLNEEGSFSESGSCLCASLEYLFLIHFNIYLDLTCGIKIKEEKIFSLSHYMFICQLTTENAAKHHFWSIKIQPVVVSLCTESTMISTFSCRSIITVVGIAYWSSVHCMLAGDIQIFQVSKRLGGRKGVHSISTLTMSGPLWLHWWWRIWFWMTS